MSDHLLIATRKGLFALERQRSGWSAKLIGFDGIAVTNVLPVDGVIYAALKHGHFGAKLHRSDDGGLNWRELAGPAFPADVADAPSLFQSLDHGSRRCAASESAVDRRHSGRLVSLRRPR